MNKTLWWRSVGALCLVAAATGCSSDTDGADEPSDGMLVNAPAPPPGGIQLVSPIFEIPASKEGFFCMEMPIDLQEGDELLVNSSTVHQGEGGHHMIVYYVEGFAATRIESAPHECEEGDMGGGSMKLLAVGSAAGAGIELPEGIAFKVPGGGKVFVQSHYINTRPEPVKVQDAVNIGLLKPEEMRETAGAFAEVALTFELPPREQFSSTIDCAFPIDGIKIPWILPHMHEWGEHFKLELVREDGSAEVLWENDWEARLRDDFPFISFDEHLEVGTKDRIRTTCTWMNTTDEVIKFPAEMCATFFSFYPSPDGALLACAENGETFNP